MTTPWTPGPWEWWTSNSFRRLSSAVTRRDGDVLCAVVQRSDGHPDVLLRNGGWDGPDGRLIAAAPELAEALQEILSYEPLPHVWREIGLAAEPIVEKYSRARALLARIKGEDAP